MYQVAVDPTAVMGRRIGAWIIDFTFASILAFVAFNAVVDGYYDIPGNLCDPDVTDSSSSDPLEPDQLMCSRNLPGKGDGLVLFDEASDSSVFLGWDAFYISLAAFVGYGLVTFVIIEGIAGASLGKLMTGLRVTTIEGRKAGPGRSIIRFALWIVDALPYCFPLAGLITGASTKGHRRVGDMAAGTYVVDKKYADHPISIPGLNGPAMPAYIPPPSGYIPGAPPMPGQPYPGQLEPPTDSPHGALIDASGDAPGATGVASEPELVHSTTPQWDGERNTYIQWDEFRSAWLQWNTDASEWRPIDEA